MTVLDSTITKERLEQLYWGERKSATEIGRILECHRSTVLYHMKRLGIPARSMSEAKVRFAKNADSRPCSKCGEVKPLSEFHSDPNTRLGRSSACRYCESARRGRPTPKEAEWTASDLDTAWLAGLMEGEAYIGVSAKNPDHQYPTVRMTSTDEDVVRRAHRIAGVGRVRGPFRPGGKNGKPHWKFAHEWMVGGRFEIIPLLKAIRPYMGSRRSEAIDEVLTFFETNAYYAYRKGNKKRLPETLS